MTTIVGIDPGPTPGLVLLEGTWVTASQSLHLLETEVVQCTAGLLLDVLAGIEQQRDGIDHLAVERFVVGRRASRSATAGAGELTRAQIGALQQLYPNLALRAAGEVKPWATDARLAAAGPGAGLLGATAGLRHARDAARHALFCAVRDAGAPDPLSKTAAPTKENSR